MREELDELHRRLRKEMAKKWQRTLPFEETLFDRWEKGKFLKFGEKTSVYQLSYIYGDVKVGKSTWIGPFTILDGTGGLEIGDHCDISAGVHIYSHDTVKRAVSGGKEKKEEDKTKIGNCCFIGPHSVIVKGVSVGDHSVVGACCFVNKDIPSFSVAVGAPAKVIGKVVIKKGKATFHYF